jgi:hypothetical protein
MVRTKGKLQYHLVKSGFTDGYSCWTSHGQDAAGGDDTKDNGGTYHVNDERDHDAHGRGEHEDESNSEDMNEEMEGSDNMSEMLDDVHD